MVYVMFHFLQESEERLRKAVTDGGFEEVMDLLEQGVNVDAADEVRYVIMWIAVAFS